MPFVCGGVHQDPASPRADLQQRRLGSLLLGAAPAAARSPACDDRGVATVAPDLTAHAESLLVRLARRRLEHIDRQRLRRAPAAVPAGGSWRSLSSASGSQGRRGDPRTVAARIARAASRPASRYERADQRLDGIGEDRLAAEAAGLQLAAAEPQHLADADLGCRSAPAVDC